MHDHSPPDVTLAPPDPSVTPNLWPRTPPTVGEFTDPPHKPGALGLGHFDVLERIGKGGFGVVMKAFDRKLLRVVAIKMMSDEAAATSAARKRFVREARAAAAVRHENVVQIHAVEELPSPHLVMEYVPGGSLQQHLDRTGPLDVPAVVKIGVQLANGLAAAHATGLVHRDIKPANVLLDDGPDLRAKITDFGLARAADDASMFQSGTVAGTPMYMAPEQARGDTLDHRADLFSLGSVLYVMCTGRPPFRASNSMAVLRRVTDDTPRPVREIVPEVPAWLGDVIARLHAKNPADRFQSARAVADALTAAGGERERDAVKQSRERRKGRWLLLAGGLALAVAVGLPVFGHLQPPLEFSAGTQPARPEPAAGVNPDRWTNAVGMTFARVPAGTGWLGGGDGTVGGERADIPADYYLGVYEVTQAEWDRVMGPGTNPSRFRRGGERAEFVADVSDADLARFPADCVSWNRSQAFVDRLNVVAPELGWRYKLPTAVEWEYACRGGPSATAADFGFDFYAGEPSLTLPADRANMLIAGRPRTCPVGSYPPNKLGLFDMHGNVWEWCEDRTVRNGQSFYLLRGGKYSDEPAKCRVRYRSSGHPQNNFDGAGFRVARVPVK